MQIFVNSVFLANNISGVTRYAIEISKELKKINPNIKFIAPPKILHQEVANELNVITFGKSKGYFWEQIMLPLFFKKRKNYILVNLQNSAPIFCKNQIVTLCDIKYIHYPQCCSFISKTTLRIIVPRVLKNCMYVITISDFSKKEICDFYKINTNKVSVIYCGSFIKYNNESIKKKIENEKYILTVSTLNYHKNFDGLLDAFNQIKDSNVFLYIVGEFTNNYNLKHLLLKIKQNNRIKYLGRVDDEKLIKLYQNAFTFIYPSFYEGFGMPTLEAQACGCPVISSNQASLPEVLQNSALYFNPYNTNDIKEKILFLLNNESVRKKLISKGNNNIKRFSWQKSAEQLYKLIESVKNQ